MSPYSLKLQNKCMDCELQRSGFFCKLSYESLKMLERAKITSAYAAGSLLFVEGQPANGVFMICQGRVKLYTCSREGKVVILRIAEAGEVLGLSGVVTNEDHEVSAEAVAPCQVNFIPKGDFLRLMHLHTDLAMNVVKHLCEQYQHAYRQIRSLGLSVSVADKLARLILEWCETRGSQPEPVRLKVPFTHGEIAEMIGTSRETVTRLLKDFKVQKLITIKGADLLVNDRKALESVIGRPRGSGRVW